jgi:hypothetical protein
VGWAMSSSVHSNITKITLAGVLITVPAAGVSVPVHATLDFGGMSNVPARYGVHPDQPPAAPSTDAPEPPPPPPPPAQPPAGWNGWDNSTVGDIGAGGGGGG